MMKPSLCRLVSVDLNILVMQQLTTCWTHYCPFLLTGSRNCVQLSMDRPNVNWTVHELLNMDVRKLHPGMGLLQTVSCGLHTVHNSFHAGCTSVSWNIEESL